MMLNDRLPKSRRLAALSLAVFFLFLFYLLSELNIYLYRSLRLSYYAVLVPVLVAGTLYAFRRRVPEYRLLMGYWLWFLLSRLLNRDLALTADQHIWFDLALSLPFFVLGQVLDGEGRRRFLARLSAVYCGYLFLLGLLGLATFVLRLHVINPITQGYLATIPNFGHKRLVLTDTIPSISSCWFMSGLLLAVYRFFACRRRLWRIPIVLCAAVFWTVTAVTLARSARMGLAVSLGLLAAALCARSLKTQKRALRALLLTLLFLLAAWAVDQGLGLTADGMKRLSAAVLQPEQTVQALPADTAESSASAESASGAERERPVVYEALSGSPLYRKLNKLSTYRLEIYACAFRTIQEDPLILLRGCLSKDAMAVTDLVLASRDESIAHYHNILLQVLILTGLPGLALMLAFCFLLLRRGLGLLFSRDTDLPLADRTLVLCVVAPLVYGMFEAFLFTDTDVRTLFFFLMGGMVLGCCRDASARAPARQ